MKRWRGELDIPNASFWRDPWGFYLRLSFVRIAFGPRFHFLIQFTDPRNYWAQRAGKISIPEGGVAPMSQWFSLRLRGWL